MSATVAALKVGEWVVIGENPTRAPVGKVARITSLTENGSVIVEADYERYLLPARCVERHADPLPGRELVVVARSTTEAPPPATRLAEAVTQIQREEPPVEPAPKRTRTLWHIGDRVRIARDQRDGPAAGTTGRIFGSSAVPGYFQVKTEAGMVVVIGEDLEPDIPQGMNRGEREAAERAAQPQPAPSRLKQALQARRQEDADVSPPGNPGVPRGSQSEAHRRAIAEGKARKKAEREAAEQAAQAAQGALADVIVEEIPDPGTSPFESAPPALRLVDRPPVVDPAATPATTSAADAPPAAAGVHNALRWAIGQGARQNLSVGALRLMVDTLEAVEKEVLRG